MTDARAAHEYWPTPPCAAIALREWLRPAVRELAGGAVVDPFAGPGLLLEHFDAPRHAIELDPQWEPHLRERCDSVTIGDAFETPWPRGNVVTNPPFSHAKKAVLKALKHRRELGGFVAFLLRTGWLQAADRLCVPMPNWMLMLTWRPSFDASGETDSYCYAWMVWAFDRPGDSGIEMAHTERLRRPAVSAEAAERHKRLACIAGPPMARQIALEV